MAAHKIFFDDLAVVDGEGQFAVFVHDVNGGDIGPSVEFHGFPVGFRGVAFSGVGCIAFYDGSLYLVDHRGPELRTEEVLVPHLSGVKLDSDPTGESDVQGVVDPKNSIGGDVLCEIDFCFFHTRSFLRLHLGFIGLSCYDDRDGLRHILYWRNPDKIIITRILEIV